MRSRAWLWLLTVTCTSVLVGATSAGAGSHDRVVTAGASGTTIRLPHGKALRVELPENPSTGYAWRTTGRPATGTLRLLSNRYVASAHAPGVVGSGGTRTWRYRGAQPGRTTLVIKLFAPGSPAKASKTFRLTVVVVPLVIVASNR